VLFAQEQPSRVSKLDRTDHVSVLLTDTHGGGALSIDAAGRVVAVQRTCTDPGRSTATGPCIEPTAIAVLSPERKTLADNIGGMPLGRLNDLVAARSGTIYFTSGGAYRVDPAGRVSSLGENIRANGIMLSRDEARSLRHQRQHDPVVRRWVGRQHVESTRFRYARCGQRGRRHGDRRRRPRLRHVNQVCRCLRRTARSSVSSDTARGDQRRVFWKASERCRRRQRRGIDGKEFETAAGVRNNAKTIYRLPMLTAGFAGRASKNLSCPS
jgi:hypothetical protein